MHVPGDAIPLWVADMDFRVPDAVTARLQEVVNHGIYGYSEAGEGYYRAVLEWFASHYAWNAKQEWIVKSPGVVYALSVCVQAFAREGESVLIQSPVYHPFSDVVIRNSRRLVSNPLVLAGDRYEIDFDDFEEKIRKEQVKLFLLCSPHNPVGRVWTREELSRMMEICRRCGVIVVSDEIHCDFTWEGHRHHILAGLDPEYEENTVICTAPSKTFNLAGLQCSNIFIPDKDLRKRFLQIHDRNACDLINTMGLAAAQAAYEAGSEWLLQLKEYLWGNILFMEQYLKEKIPQLGMLRPEGTYLVWMDARGLGFTEQERQRFFLEKAKVWLNSGRVFGPEGEGFERVNIACPRPVLKQALEQLKAAADTL